jgi:hypothetical protein
LHPSRQRDGKVSLVRVVGIAATGVRVRRTGAVKVDISVPIVINAVVAFGGGSTRSRPNKARTDNTGTDLTIIARRGFAVSINVSYRITESVSVDELLPLVPRRPLGGIRRSNTSGRATTLIALPPVRKTILICICPVRKGAVNRIYARAGIRHERLIVWSSSLLQKVKPLIYNGIPINRTHSPNGAFKPFHLFRSKAR